MKWIFFILANLQLLVAKAQDDNYKYLLEEVFNEPDTLEKEVFNGSGILEKEVFNGSDILETSTPCGLNKICVPMLSCNQQKKTSGRGLIDIRNNYKPCNYLQKCCYKNNVIDQTILPPDILSSTRDSTVSPPCNLPCHTPTHNQTESIRKVSSNIGCGYRNKDGLVFGLKHAYYNEAQYSEFPWVVAILQRDSNKPLLMECGGSIITPFIVLTAAHCINGKDPSILTVRAGEWDIQTKSEPYPYQDRSVKEIIQQELFNKETLFFDMALLILKDPLEFVPNVQPICLPSKDQDFDDSHCFVAGWGKHKFGRNGRYQQILKKIDVPMVPWEKCQNLLRKTRLERHFELDESFVCAGGERGQDACTGDGGSPLVCRIPGSNERYFQAGIVSWGIGCGEQDVPGVYANTLYMLPWLTETLDKLNADQKYYTA